MTQQDFKYLNIPALLDGKAWAAVNDSLVEDDGWQRRLSDRLFHMVLFFREHGLLARKVPEDISTLVLFFSDFTEEGQRLIRSGAPDKWLASFDREPEKPSSDVSLMTRKLKALRKAEKKGSA